MTYKDKLIKQHLGKSKAFGKIKKQGKIPFTEHMTVAGATVVVPTELAVHQDIKREIGL